MQYGTPINNVTAKTSTASMTDHPGDAGTAHVEYGEHAADVGLDQGLGKVRACLVGDGRVSGVSVMLDASDVMRPEHGRASKLPSSSFASVPACLGVAGEAE
jgi:hypothetical protein